MKATEQKVLRFIKENELLLSGEKILIALSGGPDSVFLLHFLNKFKNKFKIEIAAVHINHRLRGQDSERDEQFCEAICKELAIPFYLMHTNVNSYAKKNKMSIELAGRKIRYKIFEKICKKNKYDKIATAHNADDNVETVLLNLIKGAGIKGIAGIPIKRQNIVRPILSLTKKEILDYLDENKFEYRIDESNLLNDFERNYLRNEIIPLIQNNLNPAFAKTSLNTSLNLQRLNLWIEETVSGFKSQINIVKNKSISIPVELFKESNVFIASYSIKEIIDESFLVKVESSDLNKIFLLAKKESGKSEELSQNLIALKNRNEVTVLKKSAPNKTEANKISVGSKLKIGNKVFSIIKVAKEKSTINKNKNEEFISGDTIKKDFILRRWETGDKFFPIGMHGSKNVSDYLNDIKINSFKKKEQLILENDGRIVWVTGKRLDERFKLTSKTKKVLKLCLK
jgi:tRNA(Ile)-lysidine synthase